MSSTYDHLSLMENAVAIQLLDLLLKLSVTENVNAQTTIKIYHLHWVDGN